MLIIVMARILRRLKLVPSFQQWQFMEHTLFQQAAFHAVLRKGTLKIAAQTESHAGPSRLSSSLHLSHL